MWNFQFIYSSSLSPAQLRGVRDKQAGEEIKQKRKHF